MKYLAIDFGQKRVGIATAVNYEDKDTGTAIAFPKTILERKTKEKFFAELLALFEKEKPDVLVVGLPVVQGEESLSLRQTNNFILSLKRRVTLPIFVIDETLSSFEAEILLQETDLKLEKRIKHLDSLAAVFILNSFLALPPEYRKKVDDDFKGF